MFNEASVAVTLLVLGPCFENRCIALLLHETGNSRPPGPLSRSALSQLLGQLQVPFRDCPAGGELPDPR